MPYSRRVLARAGLLLVLAAASAAAEPRVLNGFTLEPAAVPVEAIREGGPGRDGVPALDQPEHVAPDAAPWEPGEPVIGVEAGGERRAYPLAVLEWHEVVNDTLGGVPILVSYCPLCGTGLVFDRRVEGKARRFGVSGLLYKSDLLMFDRESESLWSQIGATAITGPARGQRLRLLRSRIEPLEAWRKRHPDTTVLTSRTGHKRTYGVSPYGDYALSERLLFGEKGDARYHPKMPTLGLRAADGAARAYPAAELVRAGGEVRERFAGADVRVSYDPDAQVFAFQAPDAVEAVEGYWFAWITFHPKSSVFVAETEAR
jgi:hypothetical protein